MNRRKKRRRGSLAVLLALAALALSAALLWRWVDLPLLPPGADSFRALQATPATGAAPDQAAHEDFSAAERQRLDDILRQKRGGAQR